MEAKYIGITHVAKEATWVCHLLSELYSPLILNTPSYSTMTQCSLLSRALRTAILYYSVSALWLLDWIQLHSKIVVMGVGCEWSGGTHDKKG